MKSACGGRMTESVQLCIQISTPTTPRHHRDEELPVANVRISRNTGTEQQIANSSKLENLRNRITVDTHGPRVSESIELLTHIAAEMKTPRCGMPESIKLYAQIGPASKTRKCTMSESTKLLTQIDAGRGQDPLEDACLERQRMR